MGGPTTSRDRNVVVHACCSGAFVLPSARLSACVRNFERTVGCSSSMFFACISIATCLFLLDTSWKTLLKTNWFRFTIYDYDSVWTCPGRLYKYVFYVFFCWCYVYLETMYINSTCSILTWVESSNTSLSPSIPVCLLYYFSISNHQLSYSLFLKAPPHASLKTPPRASLPLQTLFDDATPRRHSIPTSLAPALLLCTFIYSSISPSHVLWSLFFLLLPRLS